MFCVRPPVPEAVRQQVGRWNERLVPLGLSIQILLERPGPGFVIVYVYREELLERTLSDGGCRRFLREKGYEPADLNGMLAQLTHRLRTRPEFPREIGVFLGCPLRDVIGFIENRGRSFTCCGFWRSYGDPAGTRACFACCPECRHRL